MAISVTGDILESQLWPQGDIRDPLGVWGSRTLVTGNGTGGSTKIAIGVPADRRAAFVYTVYSVNAAKLTGAASTETAKTRLLTNYPNIDPLPGVQGYSSAFFTSWTQPVDMTPPVGGFASVFPLGPFDRFILCFDPRQEQTLGRMEVIEIEINDNVDLETWSFEAYGYYWDRSVMNAPGGPRHPGSS